MADAAPCARVPSGAIAWWPFEGNANDAVGNHAGQLQGSPTTTSGRVGQAFDFDSLNDRILVEAGPDIDVGDADGFTIEGWINPGDLSQLRPIVEWNSGNIGAHFWSSVPTASSSGVANLYANIIDVQNRAHQISTRNDLLTFGVWQHVALTYNKLNGEAAIFHNGNRVAQQNLGRFTALTSGDLYFGYRPSGPFSGILWRGGMDEMSLYGRSLTAAEIQSIFAAGSAGKCRDIVPPSQTFDLSQDFAILNNPNGVWSYGYLDRIGGAFTLLDTPRNEDTPETSLWSWSVGGFAPPLVYFNAGTNTFSSDGGVYPPGTVWFCPGTENSGRNLGAIRLTLPATAAGTYRLETSVSPYIEGSVIGDTDFHVVRNGTELFGRQLGPQDRTGFTNSLALAAGDTIDFVIGRGADDLFLGSCLKIQARLVSSNVPPTTNCIARPDGAIAWWRAEGDAADALGAHPGTLLFGAEFAAGHVGQAFSFGNGRSRMTLADREAFKLTSSLSFEGWINPVSVDTSLIFIRGDNRPGLDPYYLGFNGPGRLVFGIQNADNDTATVVATDQVVTGAWTHVAAVLDGATGFMGLYLNGVLAVQTTTTIRPAANLQANQEPSLGLGNSGGTVHDFPFRGLIDEWTLYKGALTAAQVQSIFAAGAAGKCFVPNTNRPPTITTQPESLAVHKGASATMRVTAEGTERLRYQWYFNGATIASANDVELMFNPARREDAGEYFVVVANDFGSVTSRVATLTVRQVRTLIVESPLPQLEGAGLTTQIALVSEGEVGGMSFVLRYDPAYFRQPVLTWSSLLGNPFTSVSTTTPGEIRATFAMSSAAVLAGTQTLAFVSFRLRSVPNDIDPRLDLELLDASTPSGDALTEGNRTQHGVVRIRERLILGDNNGNQRLDVGDAAVMLRFLAQLDEVRSWDISGNDLNQNNRLDSGDAIKSLRVAAGIDPTPTPRRECPECLPPLPDRILRVPSEQVVLVPLNQRVTAGGTATIQVQLQNVSTPILGAALTIEYPSTVLRMANASAHRLGPLVPANSLSMWNVSPGATNYGAQSGQVTLVISSAAPWPMSNGVLAELTFQVRSEVTNQLAWPLQVRDFEMTDDGYRLRTLPKRGTALFTADPRPGVLTPIQRTSFGIAFNLLGATGVAYTIEVSTNLHDWTAISVINPENNVSGVMEVLDSRFPPLPGSPPMPPYRFYRARSGGP